MSARVDDLARGLRQPVEADGLWERIESALTAAAAPRRMPWTSILATAAALLAVALLLRGMGDAVPSTLLADGEALVMSDELELWESRLERLEPAYFGRPQTERVSPVRGQLDYLQANIDRCRKAASANKLNRVVRRSLVDSTRRRALLLESLLTPSRTE